MNTTSSLTNTYWDMLKPLDNSVKLQLAARLTASVAENAGTTYPCTYSVEELRARVRQGVEEAYRGMGKTTDELMIAEIIHTS